LEVAVKTNVKLKCVSCGMVYPPDPRLYECGKCGGLLTVEYDFSRVKISWNDFDGKGVWRYKQLLPPSEELYDKTITLHEGNTPLIKLENLVTQSNVYVKFEGANPTGSFKDRGMTVAITLAKHIGSRLVIVASTGNTAASVSAYASRANIKSAIVLPKGKVALGKLAQSILHGALIFEIEGNFDDALDTVRKVVEINPKIYPLNSFNPWRLEGQKTLAFEVAEELGVPDWVIVPVGNAGNISAIWKGFKELYELKLISKLPKMVGVQSEGASPLATAFERGLDEPIFVDKPETIATAIRIGRPINWPKAMMAVKESKGLFLKVSDREIIDAMAKLGSMEGIDAEPAGASSIAGYLKLLRQRIIGRKDKVVCVVTGHALKDPDAMLRISVSRISVSKAEAVETILKTVFQ